MPDRPHTSTLLLAFRHQAFKLMEEGENLASLAKICRVNEATVRKWLCAHTTTADAMMLEIALTHMGAFVKIVRAPSSIEEQGSSAYLKKFLPPRPH